MKMDPGRMAPFPPCLGTAVLLLALACSGGDRASARQPLDARAKQAAIDSCLAAFARHYVLPERVPAMRARVLEQAELGAYSELADLKALTRQLRIDLREASGDRHIWVDTMAEIREKPGPPSAEELAARRAAGYGFTRVERLSGGIGLLVLDGFQDPAYAGEAAAAAMRGLAGSRAVIIDLRANHGGEAAMVEMLASYFLPAGTPLDALYFSAADSLRKAQTLDAVPGERLLAAELILLVSGETASAAESFASTLQAYGRARLVGERTRGAAHWTETFAYPEQGFFLEIPVARPINPVTNGDWEGVGVQPDVAVPAAQALAAALAALNQAGKPE